MRSRISIGSMAIAIALAGAVFGARASSAPQDAETADVMLHKIRSAVGELGAMAQRINAGGLRGLDLTPGVQYGVLGRVVTGAAYSATVATESVQTLEDGNRIVHRDRFFVARDAAGRVVRQQADAEGTMRTTALWDPVAGAVFVFDHASRTATRRPLLRGSGDESPASGVLASKIFTKIEDAGRDAGNQPRAVLVAPDAGQEATSPLGTQTLENLRVEGTLTVTTIPAGAAGNERPIVVRAERWLSPDLLIPVLKRRHDPRTGRTLYQLQDVAREAPAAALFGVPAGYAIVDPEQH